jgi:hypothetical protein
MQGGFRLIKERPGAMLIWTLIQLAVTIGTSYAAAAILQDNIDAVMSGTSVQSAQATNTLQTLLLSLAGLIIAAIVYAAVQRAILRPTEGGPGWLMLGMDEVRFYLLILLYLIIFTVAAVVVTIVLGIFFAGSGPEGAQTMMLILLVLGFIACSYFGTKVSLTFPLTLKERAFAIGEGWGLTNGRFWTLFGTYFLIFLIMLVVGAAIMAATRSEYMSAVFQYGLASPEAQVAAYQENQELLSGTPGLRMIIGWVLGGVQGAIGYALFGGAAATAVQQLTADEEGLSETFS